MITVVEAEDVVLSQNANMDVFLRVSWAALAFIVYEFCVTISDEVNCIWRMKWAPIKFLFMGLRYFPLVGQIAHQIIMIELKHRIAFQPWSCGLWYGYQLIGGSVLLMAIELILMLRVYILYDSSKRIGALLCFLYIGHCALKVISGVLTLRQLDFDANCAVSRLPGALLLCIGGAVLTESTIWVLTMLKTSASSGMGGMVPMISLMMKDGATFAILICALLVATILHGLSDRTLPQVINGWFLCILSSSGCRLIINMQRLAMSDSRDASIYDISTGVLMASRSDFVGTEAPVAQS
jgi:hypothetical protein